MKRLSFFGFALLLSTMAHAQSNNQGAVLGGYGELHYNNVTYDSNGPASSGNLDFHRFIFFAGYNFNDWISFNSELELEHTLLENENGIVEGGEIALEQAYVDLRFKPELGLRAGILLVPVGIVNPVHEPPTFNGVERPNVEKYLIPSTWRESGIGVYGSNTSGLSYQAYLMAGLKPNEINGDEGIREARQSGFESSTANMAFTGRLDYQPNLNLQLGLSYFISSLENRIEDGQATKINALNGALFNLIETHAIYKKNRFEARGLLVWSGINKVTELNTEYGNDAGKSQLGGYAEVAYDILPSFSSDAEQQLLSFVRFESYDTHFKTEQILNNSDFAHQEVTLGFTYKPAPRVAFKADYQLKSTLEGNDLQQFNLGVGYNF